MPFHGDFRILTPTLLSLPGLTAFWQRLGRGGPYSQRHPTSLAIEKQEVMLMHIRHASIGSMALLVALVAMLISPVAASASGRSIAAAPHRTLVMTERVPMSLDCSHLSAGAQQHAKAHNLCTAAVTPHGRVPGDCGWSEINLYNDFDGTFTIEYGFHSSAGTVVARSLTVSYQDRLGGASFDDSNNMFSSDYTASRRAFVGGGPGQINAALDGSVLLVWLATCTMHATASANY
jgi:hypothetical protein